MQASQLEVFYKHKSAVSHAAAILAIYEAGMLAGAAGYVRTDDVPTIDGPFGADAPFVATGEGAEPNDAALTAAIVERDELARRLDQMAEQTAQHTAALTGQAAARIKEIESERDALAGAVEHLEGVIRNLQTPQADKPVAGGEGSPTDNLDGGTSDPTDHHPV